MAREKKTKRRPSGYNLYIKECMQSHSSEMKGKAFGAAAPFMKKCSADWKAMSEALKQPYKDRSTNCELDESNKWVC